MLSVCVGVCMPVCVCVCVRMGVCLCVSWRDDSGQSAGSLSCQPVTHWQICCSYTVQATPHWCTHCMCVYVCVYVCVCLCVCLRGCLCVIVICSLGIARILRHVVYTQTPVCVSDWENMVTDKAFDISSFKNIFPLLFHFTWPDIWQWQKIEEQQRERDTEG